MEAKTELSRRKRYGLFCILLMSMLSASVACGGATRALVVWGPGAGSAAFMSECFELGIAGRLGGWASFSWGNNVTAPGLANLIARAFAAATDDDLSIIYLNGHAGKLSELFTIGRWPPDEPVIATADSEDEYINTGGAVLDDEFQVLRWIGSEIAAINGQVVLIVDSCYAGGFTGGADDFAVGGSDVFMFATSETDLSISDVGSIAAHGHSYYSGSLISALLEDPTFPGTAYADVDLNRSVTISEWVTYANPKARRIAAANGFWQVPGVVGAPAGLGTAIHSLGAFFLHTHVDPDAARPWAKNLPAGYSPVAEAIYDKLLDTDSQGNLTPELLASYDVREDERAVTLYLRPEAIRFSDGSLLTAQVVAENLTQAVVLFDDPVELLVLRPSLVEIGLLTSVSVVGEGVVELALAPGVNAEIVLETLAGVGGMVRQLAVQDRMIGAGPYVFEWHVAGDEICLTSNEFYWRSFTGPSELCFLDWADVGMLVAAMQDGYVHMALWRGEDDRARLDTIPEFSVFKNDPLSGVDEEIRHVLEDSNDFTLYTVVGPSVGGYCLFPDDVMRIESLTFTGETMRIVWMDAGI